MGKDSKRRDKIPVNDSQLFANTLNQYFSRFDIDDRMECNEICKNLPPTSLIEITEEAVSRSLSKLKPGKATGPDGLKTRLLKDCAPQLKGVLSRLFTTLIKTGVPTSWKSSIVTPIPKKPGAFKPEDFRPIAITSNLCKTMERVLADTLTTTLASRLDPLQFAYKSNRGTDDAIDTDRFHI